jgi:hypothetical protein
MKQLTAAAVLTLLLGGCASMHGPQDTKNYTRSAKVVYPAPKHTAPCPCSPTANETVKKRWFSGWKIRFFH